MADKKDKSEQDISLLQLNYGDGKKKNTGYSRAVMKKACDNGRNIEEWLADFIREMLVKRCCDHFPFAVIQTLYKTSDRWPVNFEAVTRENIEEQLEKEYSPYRCYLEAFALVDARVPDESPKELQKRAKDRFAPMLEGWVHE